MKVDRSKLKKTPTEAVSMRLPVCLTPTLAKMFPPVLSGNFASYIQMMVHLWCSVEVKVIITDYISMHLTILLRSKFD